MRISVATLACVTLAACQAQDPQLRADIDALRSEVDSLKAELAMQSLQRLAASLSGVAFLTPGADGYSTIEMDLGKLTVSLENVQPYANGSRVTLHFGNTLAATINGVKATIEWGPVNQAGMPLNDAVHSKEVTFNEPFQTGRWTSVNVVLEGTPPAELGFVRIRGMTHTGIRLFR